MRSVLHDVINGYEGEQEVADEARALLDELVTELREKTDYYHRQQVHGVRGFQKCQYPACKRITALLSQLEVEQ